MAKPTTIKCILKDGKVVCDPPQLKLKPGASIQWISEDGDLAVSILNSEIQFDVVGWVSKKGKPSKTGVFKSGTQPGFTPTIILSDPESQDILNPKGGGPIFH